VKLAKLEVIITTEDSFEGREEVVEGLRDHINTFDPIAYLELRTTPQIAIKIGKPKYLPEHVYPDPVELPDLAAEENLEDAWHEEAKAHASSLMGNKPRRRKGGVSDGLHIQDPYRGRT
jgi:hypothetical protein